MPWRPFSLQSFLLFLPKIRRAPRAPPLDPPLLKQRNVGVCVRMAGSTIFTCPTRIPFVFSKNKKTKVLFHCCPHVKYIKLIWVYFHFFFFFFFEWPLFIAPLRLKAAMASEADSSSMGSGSTSFNGPTVSAAWKGLNVFIKRNLPEKEKNKVGSWDKNMVTSRFARRTFRPISKSYRPEKSRFARTKS